MHSCDVLQYITKFWTEMDNISDYLHFEVWLKSLMDKNAPVHIIAFFASYVRNMSI